MPKAPASTEKKATSQTSQSDTPKSSQKSFASPPSVPPSFLTTGVIDVSGAANSAQALQMVEAALHQLTGNTIKTLDINAGHLLLTRAVLAKVGLHIKKYGITLNAVFSKVPQTQQAALDEGFFVKEAPSKPALSSLEQLHQHLEQETTPTRPAGESPQDVLQNKLNELVGSSSASPFKVNEQIDIDSLFDILPERMTTIDAPDLVDYPSRPSSQSGTLLVKGNLRSGQVLRFAGNLVVLGDAHAGSEITADGDIVIWGELLGIAHAGANGNNQAEIRAMKIEALQLRIADHIARRPDRMYYHKPQGANAMPTPEVARVHEGEIRVFKESIGH